MFELIGLILVLFYYLLYFIQIVFLYAIIKCSAFECLLLWIPFSIIIILKHLKEINERKYNNHIIKSYYKFINQIDFYLKKKDISSLEQYIKNAKKSSFYIEEKNSDKDNTYLYDYFNIDR